MIASKLAMLYCAQLGQRTLQIGILNERRNHYIEWGLPVTPNLAAIHGGFEGSDWGHGGGRLLFGTPRQC